MSLILWRIKMGINRDLRSNLEVELAFNQEITSSTTTASTFIFDTAHYDGGAFFGFSAPAWSDGTYTPKIEHSDDSGMAGAVDVPAANIIGSVANAVLSAATAEGDAVPTLGIVGVKRYVRISIVSAGVSSGATIVVPLVKKPELLPAVDPDA
jgi:hypothetical protein